MVCSTSGSSTRPSERRQAGSPNAVTVSATEGALERDSSRWTDAGRRRCRLHERSLIVVDHLGDDRGVDQLDSCGDEHEHRVNDDTDDIDDIDDGCTVNDVGVDDDGRRANDQRCACIECDDATVGHHHEPHSRRAPAVGTVHGTRFADRAHC